MLEQLQNRANTIKNAIREHPERGAELLADFAERYGINSDLADETLLILFELQANPDLPADKKEAIAQQLEHKADEVVARYDEEKVALRLEYEAKVIEAAKKRKVQDSVVLVAENIKKNYRSSKFHLSAEKIELRLGEITGLVGENATGKTTLFRILAGDLAPAQGRVRYPLLSSGKRLSWGDLKLKIAYVPQELPAWQGSLLENLRFEAARHGILGAANLQSVEYIVQRLGLGLYLDKSWAELSGGYKLRFALAKALVWKPQLLILDEPLAFLDVKAQMTVLTDLQALAKSLRDPIAVLISSQHLHETEAVADQMWFMREGHLENLGPTKAMGKDRTCNFFEVGCALAFKQFEKRLQDIPYYRVWDNGVDFYIATPLSIDAEQMLLYLLKQGVVLHHFRDISTSVKTKFYENLLL